MWTEDLERCRHTLVQKIKNSPLISRPIDNVPYKMALDALRVGISLIVIQDILIPSVESNVSHTDSTKYNIMDKSSSVRENALFFEKSDFESTPSLEVRPSVMLQTLKQSLSTRLTDDKSSSNHQQEKTSMISTHKSLDMLTNQNAEMMQIEKIKKRKRIEK
jgi:hypothetical protein